MADLQKIVDDLSSLTVLEAAELAKLLEEKWGVSAAAAVAVALTLGGVVPASAQQISQDHSTLPGYSARPPGMCWHRHFGSAGNETNGYWAACTSTSENQPASSARAQAQPTERNRTRHR